MALVIGNFTSHQSVTDLLLESCDDPKEGEQRANYLSNNGMLRIVITNDKLSWDIKAHYGAWPHRL